jgi:DNA-binding transcriptional LysR family regulator
VNLRFVSWAADIDIEREEIDFAIRFGRGNWPRSNATMLFNTDIYPVCNPSLLGSKQISKVEDLLGQTLLDRSGPGGPGINWSTFFSGVGCSVPRAERRILFDNYQLLIRAAIAGQGIALGWDVLVAELISRGVLVCPIQARWKPEGAYFLVSWNRPLGQHGVAFKKWLQEVARDSRTGCDLTGVPLII